MRNWPDSIPFSPAALSRRVVTKDKTVRSGLSDSYIRDSPAERERNARLLLAAYTQRPTAVRPAQRPIPCTAT